MVRITPEHHTASGWRAAGWTYVEIAREMWCTPDQVKQWVEEYSRVHVLQLVAEQEDTDGEDVGS